MEIRTVEIDEKRVRASEQAFNRTTKVIMNGGVNEWKSMDSASIEHHQIYLIFLILKLF